MADATSKPKAEPKPKPKPKTSKRTTALLALLAVVVVLALWLSNCIPGFGFGGAGDAEGDAQRDEAAEPATPEPKPEPEVEPPPVAEPAPNKTLTVKIGLHGCSVNDQPAVECAKLCERAELFEGIDDAVLDTDSDASHASVVAMTDCLKSKGIDKLAIRRGEPSP